MKNRACPTPAPTCLFTRLESSLVNEQVAPAPALRHITTQTHIGISQLVDSTARVVAGSYIQTVALFSKVPSDRAQQADQLCCAAVRSWSGWSRTCLKQVSAPLLILLCNLSRIQNCSVEVTNWHCYHWMCEEDFIFFGKVSMRKTIT